MVRKGLAAGLTEEELQERAYALVGKYMSHWAILERALNVGVETLCGPSKLGGAVITANMNVRDKINTVTSMMYVSCGGEKEMTKAHQKLMRRIGNCNGDRNLAAHTQFTGHEKGVEFFVIKAKSKIEIPVTIWSVDEFSKKFDAILDCAQDLEGAINEAKARLDRHYRSKLEFSVLHALLAGLPSEGTNTLKGLSALGQSYLANPDSPSPTQEPAREKPPAPRKKEAP